MSLEHDVEVCTFDVAVDNVVCVEVQETSGSSESDVGTLCPAERSSPVPAMQPARTNQRFGGKRLKNIIWQNRA